MRGIPLHRWLATFLVAASLLATPAPARAQDSAREHYRRGLSAYGLGDFAAAATEYEAAFKARPDPALLYNAAQAHRLAGNAQRALELYQSYLRLFESQVPNRAEVERRIADLRLLLRQQREQRLDQAAAAKVDASPPAAESHPGSPAVVAPAPAATMATGVDVSQGRVDVAPSPSPRPPTQRRKRTWIWGTAVGVAAAGLAVGLGVGLGAHERELTPSMGRVVF